MPETDNEQVDKNQLEKRPTETTPETEGEVSIETLPPQEVEKIRETIIEEISEAEKPQELVKPQISQPVIKPAVSPTPPAVKSPTFYTIEKIMEEGLEDVYLSMPEEQQKIFKEEGEKTVTRIEQLLNKVKIKIKEIIRLIRDWLKLIPGVNKFFLEQEAKIKTDKILKIKNE